MKFDFTRRLFLSRTVAAFAAAVFTPLSKSLAQDRSNEGRDLKVKIHQFSFVPDKLKVKTGDRITWVNLDFVPHTATAKDGSWDTGILKQNESKTITLTESFGNEYYCDLHPSMIAALQAIN